MFIYSNWIVESTIDGYKKGLTPVSKVSELTQKYLRDGTITQEQADEIGMACPVVKESEDVQ